MEAIKTIGELIPGVKQSPQVSSPSHLANYHIQGVKIEWNAAQVDSFWRRVFLETLKEVEPRFVVDDNNKNLLSALYGYVWGSNQMLDSSKGLLLWGPIGVGKSVLLKGLQRYYGTINRYCFGSNSKYAGFRMVSAAEIALLYAEKGMSGIAQFTDRECMCNLAIDELGREPMDAKHFGTGINVIQTILQLRYEVRNEFFTLATTNLDPNLDFVGRYGDYIADRVKEMFNVIEIKGTSRR